jgi:hypothetical protein
LGEGPLSSRKKYRCEEIIFHYVLWHFMRRD